MHNRDQLYLDQKGGSGQTKCLFTLRGTTLHPPPLPYPSLSFLSPSIISLLANVKLIVSASYMSAIEAEC